ncbi:DUF3726 domain-containing protein [Sinorhizobium sp. RAC02]|uniref:DUF3726 domain-containing protein n=1 Tax=Sinorhizobium sp. RAC02 TaxID=1842534 RepID=UPI00083CDB8A|nr:DUF3726 domain-containing protein [Sinorhizobium sp. RAC02]AOF92720.1 hypothetical protein BSY16_4748 [Sinorhizobium sp. RAC02]
MKTILLSYNEVQSLARKAASGAGLPHGVAEEIGHAAIWLSARGVDAIRIVVDALGDDARGRQAVLRDQAAVDALCCGEAEQVWLRDREYGLLLIGLAGAAAIDTGLSLAVQQGNGDLMPLARVSDAGGLLPAMKTLRLMPDDDAPACSGTPRPTATDAAAYATALRLAARTYVPASDLSRTQGAGAGTTDND